MKCQRACRSPTVFLADCPTARSTRPALFLFPLSLWVPLFLSSPLLTISTLRLSHASRDIPPSSSVPLASQSTWGPSAVHAIPLPYRTAWRQIRKPPWFGGCERGGDRRIREHRHPLAPLLSVTPSERHHQLLRRILALLYRSHLLKSICRRLPRFLAWERGSDIVIRVLHLHARTLRDQCQYV